MAKRKNSDDHEMVPISTATDGYDDAGIGGGVANNAAQPPGPTEPSPATVAPAPPQEATVSWRVFATACGASGYQTAGFQHYARKNNLGPRTMKEWRAVYSTFLNSPT